MNRLPGWRIMTIGMLLLATASCLLAIRGAQAQTNAPNGLQGLREHLRPAIIVQQRHYRKLMADRNIIGVAVGLTANREPAIKVFTKSQAIMNIPTTLEGLPVEVEFVEEFRALGQMDDRGGATNPKASLKNPAKLFPRPVPIGISVGNEHECSSGTIAARVKDAQGQVFALSNNHVFALENLAPLNSAIVQPGLANSRCLFDANNAIGALASFVPIDFSDTAANTVDAAIALSDVSLLDKATPSNGYGTPQSTTVAPFVGQKVQKYGLETKLRRGQVIGINATVIVEYASGPARFVDQIIVGSKKGFIKAGDSGSLLVTDPGANPVGLLFAGDKQGKMAVANSIDEVLNSLGVSIDGQ